MKFPLDYILCLNYITTESQIKYSKMPEYDAYIGINLKPETKKKFKKACKDRGSNMTIELRRFIHSQINKEKNND